MAVVTLELEMDYPSETSLCTVAPSPQTPLLRFFQRGGGGCTQAIWNGIPSSNCPSKLTDKVMRVVYSKLKLFHSSNIKKYYLPDGNHQTDNPSHTNNPSLVCENGHFCYNECRAPALGWAFACPLLLFHKDYF